MTISDSDRPSWLPDGVEAPPPAPARPAPGPAPEAPAVFSPPPPPAAAAPPVVPPAAPEQPWRPPVPPPSAPLPPPPPAAMGPQPKPQAPAPPPDLPMAEAVARWSRPAAKARFYESTFLPLAALGLIGVIAAGVLGFQHLQPSGDDSAPTVVAAKLQYAYRPAAVHRFAVSQQLSALLVLPDGKSGRAYSDLQAVEDWRVISVAPNGKSATLGIRFESMSGEFDGIPLTFNASKAKELQVVVASDGRIVSGGTGGTIGGSSTTQDPGGDLFSSLLPNHDVKVGDAWGSSYSRPNPMGNGNMTYTTNNTLVGVDGTDGQQAAVVQTDYTLPIDMLLNLRQLDEWTGDDTSHDPAGAAVSYAGNETGRVTSYVSLDTHQLLHAAMTSDFQFDMTFSGLPNTAEYKDLGGKFHFGGHLQTSLQNLNPASAASV